MKASPKRQESTPCCDHVPQKKGKLIACPFWNSATAAAMQPGEFYPNVVYTLDQIAAKLNRPREWTYNTLIRPIDHKTKKRLRDEEGNVVPGLFHYKHGACYLIPGQSILEWVKTHGAVNGSDDLITSEGNNRGLVNRKDAAAYLSVSVLTIDRLRKAGKIKAIVIPSTTARRYTKRSLDSLIERQAKKKASNGVSD